MKSYSDISLKYIKQNRKRSALTILGITLAVLLIFAVGTFCLSFFESTIQQERKRADFEFKLSDVNKDNVESVKNNVEVKDTSISLNKPDIYSIRNTDKTVNLVFGNEEYYDKIYDDEDIIEGNIPTSSNEVVIDSLLKEKIKLGVGDKLTIKDSNNNEMEYNIVGIQKYNSYATGQSFILYSYLDNNSYVESDQYSVYVNLKSKKNKQKIINNVIEDSNISLDTSKKNDNTELLYLTGNGGSSAIGKTMKLMAAFVIGIIVVCTITVIYNSFNISVIERMRYFGVLKAIGATSSQIKRIIFKEGFLMGLIAFPIGCLIGFLGLKYGIKLFIGNNLMMVFDQFEIMFYPSILIVTFLVEFITIYLSLLMPAHKAKKVSAIEAMRNQNEIKMGKIKNRKGRLVQKVFGIEGNIAYKNIRRTPFRFIVTIVALTISIILFNVFYGFIDYSKQIVSQQFVNLCFDAQLQKNSREIGFSDDEISKIESLSFVDDYYLLYSDDKNIAIDSNKINPDYENKTKNTLGIYSIDDLNYKNSRVFFDVAFNEKDFEPINKYIDNVSYEDLNDGGVILIDGSTITNSSGKKEIVRATNYKVGDTIKIPKVNDQTQETEAGVRNAIQNNQFIEAKIIAITNIEPYGGMELTREIGLIFSDKGYEKLNQKVMPNIFGINFNNDSEKKEEAAKYFLDNSETMGVIYQDVGEIMKQVDDLYSQVEFFVYCFIIIVTVISIVNIYNTISTSILLRKKEFSTLKAIGMTQAQLKKSVILEGTLYGIISAIFGGIISVILSKILISLGGGLGTYDYKFPIVVFSLSILAAIFVTYISTLIPLNRLKKLTIVEGISDEE